MSSFAVSELDLVSLILPGVLLQVVEIWLLPGQDMLLVRLDLPFANEEVAVVDEKVAGGVAAVVDEEHLERASVEFAGSEAEEVSASLGGNGDEEMVEAVQQMGYLDLCC